ncbi:MAG: GNAT family N-acetyltransferase [Bdellovibrio sp.]|nr:GNAT family N-acetyltransferase [Bdellovibrio sp.]
MKVDIWPSTYTQKITLNNGRAIVLKKRPDQQGQNSLNLITLYAEDDMTHQCMGEASLLGPPENARFRIQVQEEFRGHGLGKKFFQTLVALARTLGITACTHIPIPPPSKKVLEKLQLLKWVHLDYDSQGQLNIHCQFNQRMRI